MNKSAQQLLTIIAESVLEPSLTKDIEQLGAKGYTIMDVRGKGGKGLRNAGWDASANIRIEVICGIEVADAISVHLQDNYYHDYAMVIYTGAVKVLRPDKF